MERKRKLRYLPIDILWLIISMIIEIINFFEETGDMLDRNLQSWRLRLKSARLRFGEKIGDLAIDVSIGILRLSKLMFDFCKDALDFLFGDIKDYEERQEGVRRLRKIVFWIKYFLLLVVIAAIILTRGFMAKTLVIIISVVAMLFLFVFSDYLKKDDL